MVPLNLFPDNSALPRLVIFEINGEIEPVNLFPDSLIEYKDLRKYSPVGKEPRKPPLDVHEYTQF